MTIQFLIPAYLRPHAGGRTELALKVDGSTLSHALGALWKAHPGLRDRVMDEQGRLRQHINIFVNSDNSRDVGGVAAPISDGAEVMIVPSIAGGNQGGCAMKHVFPVLLCGLILSAGLQAQNSALYGTWRLVSGTTTVVATGEKYDTFGKAPQGFITYGPEGRMQVIIVFGQRLKPSHAAIADMTETEAKELLRTVTAYSGKYTFDGKTVTHHIDVSWNAVWTGTDQVRDVLLDGEKATFTTKPAPSPRDGRLSVGTLVWERVK